ncbi:DUF3199 family protein [uncultured Oscillibacter sp.]|jgi:hypothetical protein|uniref:DUF3199 family protein n=1 Tax=uncultured Oscillibacter sp. TaxID=876091 RepID=UPI002670436F|nr:DUF3199 family protein [uncultured Oscillibacter sp.]
MAERPWVLPKEIKAYTDIEAVQQRKKDKLEMDIARAEQYVITYTHNRFEGYDKIPGPVRTAVILLAEAYASYANQLKKTGGGAVKSETFDDYSYTAGEGTFEDFVKALDLAALLDDFVIKQASGTVTMRMRRL